MIKLLGCINCKTFTGNCSIAPKINKNYIKLNLPYNDKDYNAGLTLHSLILII